jgi:SMP-30/gluconolaconase/LRE-like protein
MRILAAALAAALSLSALGQQDVEDARRGVAAVERLLEQRPGDPTLWFYLARFQAQAGDTAASVSALQRVAEQGEGFMPRREDFARAWDDPAFQSVLGRIEAKLPRLDYAPTAFELDDAGLVPEGIAYDAASRSFFVGSIAQRKVVRVSEDGAAGDFAVTGGGLDAVLGLAMDSPRRLLYVVSTSGITAQGAERLRNAVLAYDVDTRKLMQRYDVPEARQLNDVAVAPGGRVFATDSGNGAVYEIAVKGPGPSRIVLPAGQLRGSNGLAASPDGKRLYVAHSTGIAVIDLAAGAVKRVDNRTRENVAAIDGLYQWRGELIGVQNGTNPGRVIRITLSRDGEAITQVKTLLSHHHNRLDEPTTLAVTDHGFFLLAATGVAHFGRDGRIDHPESMPKPTILRIPLP